MGSEQHQLLWLEDEEEDQVPQEQIVQLRQLSGTSQHDKRAETDALVAQLESELQRTRKELQDVRKDLAAKTVQLSRKEVVVVHEKVAELAASVTSEKDRQLQHFVGQVEQLELALAAKEEELEESRRMYNAQKRALREALATAAEVEAVERQADEARARTVAAQAVEDELDRLQHELALLQARSELELRARDTELQALRQELMAMTAGRKEAIAAAEGALTEAWQQELTRATEAATARIAELEQDLSRARAQLEEQARSGDAAALAGELAALNQQKVAIQREFEAFKEMATAAARQNREDAARLLEESAALKARLAAKAYQEVASGAVKPHSKVFTAQSHATSPDHVAGSSSKALLGGLLPGAWGEAGMPMEFLAQLERQRRGLVPALVISALLLLFVLVAVIRAAAVTRSEHRGGLCFLAHLGITLGQGCGNAGKRADSIAAATGTKLGELLEQAPRVHDVAVNPEAVASANAGKVPGEGKVLRRLLAAWLRTGPLRGAVRHGVSTSGAPRRSLLRLGMPIETPADVGPARRRAHGRTS